MSIVARLFTLFLLFALISPARAQHKQPHSLHVGFETLYTTDGSHLYTIDLNTAEVKQGKPLSEQVYPELTADPLHNVFYTLLPGEQGTVLATISPQTGQVRRIGFVTDYCAMLTYDRLRHVLYAATKFSYGHASLLTIDPATGKGTLVENGDIGGTLVSLSCNATGVLYVTTSGDIREPPALITFPLNVSPFATQIAWDSMNNGYGIVPTDGLLRGAGPLYAYTPTLAENGQTYYPGKQVSHTTISSARPLTFLPSFTGIRE